jgi:hypothetical protein
MRWHCACFVMQAFLRSILVYNNNEHRPLERGNLSEPGAVATGSPLFFTSFTFTVDPVATAPGSDMDENHY